MSESICYGRLLAAHDYDILAAQDNATMQELTHAINQLTLAVQEELVKFTVPAPYL